MENAVAQQLRANGHPLFFYSKYSEVKEERMEIDFLIVRPSHETACLPRRGKIRQALLTRFAE